MSGAGPSVGRISLPIVRSAPFASARGFLRLLLAEEGLVLLWAIGTTAFFLGVGDARFTSHAAPNGTADFEDALWHLGTTALLALPTRRWAVIAGAPLLSLGLDFDHLPSVFGFEVDPRPDHCLVFVAVAAIVLAAWQGRTAGLAFLGAVVSHIGLDGGKFPLLSPSTPMMYPLSFADQALLIALGALLLYVSVRRLGSLGHPRNAVAFTFVVGLLAALVYFVWPALGIFTHV